MTSQVISGLVLMAFCLGLYFLPFIIALARSHANKVAVFVLNLFLGWTLIGWVIALVWSFTNAKPQTIIINNGPAAAPAARVEPSA